MTLHECLLFQVAEEAAELMQECSKYARFTGDSTGGPEHPYVTPRIRLIREYLDLTAMMLLLEDQGLLTLPTAHETGIAVQAKIKKVRKYLLYSMALGTVESTEFTGWLKEEA